MITSHKACHPHHLRSPFSRSELLPPHGFRRRNIPEIQKPNLIYLASYHAATGKILNAEMEGARRLSQEELVALARHYLAGMLIEVVDLKK
jgi:hypothetical protein